MMFLRIFLKIRTKFFTLVFLSLLGVNDVVTATEKQIVQIYVKQDFIDEVKKPSADQKNGMLVFTNPNNIQKFASGVFPTMTKYYDLSFIELIDIVTDGRQAINLKQLYWFYMKLSNLINNISASNKSNKKNSEEKEDYKEIKKSVKTNCEDISNCLNNNNFMQDIDLGEEKKDWQDKYGTTGLVGNQLTKKLLDKVGSKLSPFINQYKQGLILYYNYISQIAPEEHKQYITNTVKLLSNKDFTPISFKQFMVSPQATWLRNYAHTEDMVIYQLAVQPALKIKPLIFSLNDICNVCRKKFTSQSIKQLLPSNIVYCSVLESKELESKKQELTTTKVDSIFSAQGFNPFTNKTLLKNICQIRINCSINLEQKWTVEFTKDGANFEIKQPEVLAVAANLAEAF